MTPKPNRPRVVSGVQPSGILHIGNYWGAIVQHLALQHEYPTQCFFFVADYHALTSIRDAKVLHENTFDIAVAYLALGLDPDTALLFRQSDVPEVTELTWLLATVTGMGLLERAHSYKDKVARGIKPSTGLFTYPLLMAADILIYRGSLVPVGRDQIQHVEMTQDIATHFNQEYSPDEPVLERPEWMLSATPRVPGIDGKKMSKSYRNTISLFADGPELRKAVSRIVTTSRALGEPLDRDGCAVLALYSLFSDRGELDSVLGSYETGTRDGAPFGYGHAKAMLVEKISDYFADARAKRAQLRRHRDDVEEVLLRSADRARRVARQTLSSCRRACGLHS